MDERETKRRGIIKNIAIIFLVIMLLLTLFSNTIMNYSLPEVTVKCSENGEISNKVRGRTVIEAKENVAVSTDAGRTVEAVYIKNGEKVKENQKLFKVSALKDGTVSSIENELEEATIAYESLLVRKLPNYILNESNIKNLKEDYELAVAKEKSCKKGQSQYKKAASEYDISNDKLKKIEKQIMNYTVQLDAVDEMESVSDKEKEMKEAKKANITAQRALTIASKNKEEANTRFGKIQEQKDQIKSSLDKAEMELENATALKEDTYYSYIYGECGNYAYEKTVLSCQKAEKKVSELKTEYQNICSKYDHEKEVSEQADEKYKTCDEKALSCKNEYEDAELNYETAKEDEKKRINKKIFILNKRKVELSSDVDAKKKKLDDLKEKYSVTYASAQTATKAAKRAWERAVEELLVLKNDESFENRKSMLEIKHANEKIEKLKKKLSKVRKENSEKIIRSPINGVISNINYMSGDSITEAMPLTNIETDELGYVCKLTVSNELAELVQVGDTGEVLNLWNEDIKVVLKSIDTSSESGAENSILYFLVTGKDVKVGKTLDISVGGNGKFYNTIVPNSSIHEDNKGKFILVIKVKNSPLGNRYIAKRADIEVCAFDDMYSAIEGDFVQSEFIITNSSKPIQSGMQVRLADGGAL